MKRFRILTFDFDSRPKLFTLTVNEEADDSIKKLHIENQTKLYTQFLSQFGTSNSFEKVQNFMLIGSKPFSVIAFHNKFLEQIRNAFILGAYYPSLTSTCALGERILNHLIIKLREDFKATTEYKKVYRKDSFDNWDLAIRTLESWGILFPRTVELFHKLKELRHYSIHFKPEADTNDKSLALSAIKLLSEIIQEQFPGSVTKPWFMLDMKGELYIKKDFETDPFVKNIYLPNSHSVGPYHHIENVNGEMIIKDDYKYEDKEISDDEFRELRLKPIYQSNC